ncbi:MAG: metalloprotease-like protein, partial [Acidobacteria bacterium]|nr:metalloprotease-like protein [Acidobacteriota bacterium]
MRRQAVLAAAVAVALVAIGAAAGCAGRTRPPASAPPPPPKRDTFVYRPLVVRSASEVVAKQAPETRPLIRP